MEDEINGVYTYDREVCKAEKKLLEIASQSQRVPELYFRTLFAFEKDKIYPPFSVRLPFLLNPFQASKYNSKIIVFFTCSSYNTGSIVFLYIMNLF